MATGEVISPACDIDTPTAVRMDFDAGPVWFVAGSPSQEEVFIPGDETLVVFTTATMQRIGYADPTFAA